MSATDNVVIFYYTADPTPGPGPGPRPVNPGPGPGSVNFEAGLVDPGSGLVNFISEPGSVSFEPESGLVDPGSVEEVETTPPEITTAFNGSPFNWPAPDIPLAQPDPEIPEIPQVPLVAPSIYTGSWALWNLLFSIVGAVLALMIGLRVLIKKRQEDNEGIEYTMRSDVRSSDEYAEDEKQKRSRLLLILAIPILAIVGCILFILTQDMRLPMTMIDRWTLAHAILLVGAIISYIFAFRKDKDEDSDSDSDSDDEQPIKQTGTA